MLKLFDEFYKDKKVFVTGHTGFKGSWFTTVLTMLGAKVSGFSLGICSTPSLFEVLNLNNDIDSFFGDVRDRAILEKTLKSVDPEIVFHFAAQSLVRKSYKEPLQTYETNIMGTINLLDILRDLKNIKVIVIITSDKCYENREWPFAYREDDKLGGFDPYSSSKACCEIVTASYRNSFFSMNKKAVATVRAGNIIGGGDWAEDRLVPDLMRALSQNKEPIIRNPFATRPWQHVMEVVFGYLYLASCMYKERDKYSDAFNFGPDTLDAVTVKDLVAKIVTLWGTKKFRIMDKKQKEHEAHNLRLDIGKTVSSIGWSPVYDIDTAISETVNWYKAYYLENLNMRHFTEEQILKFVDTAKIKNKKWLK